MARRRGERESSGARPTTCLGPLRDPRAVAGAPSYPSLTGLAPTLGEIAVSGRRGAGLERAPSLQVQCALAPAVLATSSR